MRTKFGWYLQPTMEEIDEAWGKGFLTLDANVLLDLYRYHSTTCQSLLDAMEAFGNRVWISDQAAQEFFRNRKSVIVAAEKTFREAKASLGELSNAIEGSIGKLRSYRLVPRASLDALATRLDEAVATTSGELAGAASSHPDYLKADPILERLLALFEGRVGDAPGEDAKKQLCEEGEQRRVAKIPPGYLDEGKDGDRAYGDFILWRQILDFSKSSGVPTILVTSERKEDWWELRAGKAVGPRMELMKEAVESTGQRVYIYQTDRFLERAAAQSGTAVDTDSVEEIREVNARRSSRRAEVAPAVRVLQETLYSTLDDNWGVLEIDLLRPVQNLTGSGHLDPHMSATPKLTVRLVHTPENCPAIQVSAGTGTNFDFNVHVRSIDKEHPLPTGLYLMEYEATSGRGPKINEDSAPSEND